MDLGINGRRALVCASSKGLGYACALALAREGADVIINGRNEDTLVAARYAIEAATGRSVKIAVADLSDKTARDMLVATFGDIDILVNNNGGPPPGHFQNWDEAAWIDAINANMVPALMLIRAFVPGMRTRKFGRIVNITSAMVKSPKGLLAI